MARLLAVVVLLEVAAIAGAGCGSRGNLHGSIGEVKTAFLHQGFPLLEMRSVHIAGIPATELVYDPRKLVTTTRSGHTVFHGQFLVVLVFASAHDSALALDDPRERRAIHAFGLTVFARADVVATLLRGTATRDRVRRVRTALAEATG